MRDKILKILYENLPYDPDFHSCFVNADNLRKATEELLALFEEEQEYYKSYFGHIRKKGDDTAFEDYSQRIDYAGIDPVKWGEVWAEKWDAIDWKYFDQGEDK